MEALQQVFGSKTIIAGVDELTQTNGILYKIKAFHRLLKEYPSFRNRVVLVQVCFQQRSAFNVYRIYENQIMEAAAHCNEDFPNSVDLRMLRGSFMSIEDRIALWKASHIYLNTSLSQGLNLHPQEFLLTRKKEGGIAIVSEFVSSHEFLNGALAVNPWDIESIVAQLEKALDMSQDEIKVRQHRDIDSISKREKRRWASNIINVVLQSETEESIQTSKQPGQDLITEDLSPIVYHLDVRLQEWITCSSRKPIRRIRRPNRGSLFWITVVPFSQRKASTEISRMISAGSCNVLQASPCPQSCRNSVMIPVTKCG